MIINNTKFDVVKLFVPKVHYDDRGFFLESYNSIIQNELNVNFVQDNHSKSKKNVVRGLHYQWEPVMGKLVRVVKGKGYDVVVDIRKDSPTYGQYEKFFLSEDNFNMVWVPGGFAHGFISLEDDTHLLYRTSGLYNKLADGAINPLCKTLNIDWEMDELELILSDKDRSAQSFLDYKLDPKF
jgi:dTDP-4-dehydrorhamnose 3,5-epimerase